MAQPFMTDLQFITRLQNDLNDPDFMAFDLITPTNEEQYQAELEDCRIMQQFFSKH